jgi:hypothetical protein
MVLYLMLTPLVFMVVVWVLVSLFRVSDPVSSSRFEPEVFPFPEDPVREPMLVGAKTIRESGRQRNRINSLASPYDYMYGHSDGLPESWWEDVLRRRN